MSRKTFEQLLDAALEAQFSAGDWRDDSSCHAPNYEPLHRRCQRTRAAVLKAYRNKRARR